MKNLSELRLTEIRGIANWSVGSDKSGWITTLAIAEAFGKEHKNVIKKLVETTKDVSGDGEMGELQTKPYSTDLVNIGEVVELQTEPYSTIPENIIMNGYNVCIKHKYICPLNRERDFYYIHEDLAHVLMGRFTGKAALRVQMKLANQYSVLKKFVNEVLEYRAESDSKEVKELRLKYDTLKIEMDQIRSAAQSIAYKAKAATEGPVKTKATFSQPTFKN